MNEQYAMELIISFIKLFPLAFIISYVIVKLTFVDWFTAIIFGIIVTGFWMNNKSYHRKFR